MTIVKGTSQQSIVSEEKKYLTTLDGTQIDVSFVPALVPRRLYPKWQTLISEIYKDKLVYDQLESKIKDGIVLQPKEQEFAKEFAKKTEEFFSLSVDIILLVLKSNGIEKDEDFLLNNFTLDGITQAVLQVSGVNTESVKKN